MGTVLRWSLYERCVWGRQETDKLMFEPMFVSQFEPITEIAIVRLTDLEIAGDSNRSGSEPESKDRYP